MEILEHVEEIETEDDLGYVITTSENIYTILIANYLN